MAVLNTGADGKFASDRDDLFDAVDATLDIDDMPAARADTRHRQ